MKMYSNEEISNMHKLELMDNFRKLQKEYEELQQQYDDLDYEYGNMECDLDDMSERADLLEYENDRLKTNAILNFINDYMRLYNKE